MESFKRKLLVEKKEKSFNLDFLTDYKTISITSSHAKTFAMQSYLYSEMIKRTGVSEVYMTLEGSPDKQVGKLLNEFSKQLGAKPPKKPRF